MSYRIKLPIKFQRIYILSHVRERVNRFSAFLKIVER